MIAKKTFHMWARQNGCGDIAPESCQLQKIIQEVEVAFLISALEPVNNDLRITVVNNVFVWS